MGGVIHCNNKINFSSLAAMFTAGGIDGTLLRKNNLPATMQNKKLIIREAESSDSFALAELMNELGYDTTADEMKIRFEHIQTRQDYKTFVAIIDTQILGMIGFTKNYSYEQNGIYVRVAALVAGSEFRQTGIGKKLMEAAENWAREIGADKILLNCGNREERTIARAFYQKIGYQIKSSGFVKKL